MRNGEKRILQWIGVIALGLFTLSASTIYIFLDCWNETRIKRNSLYCYACISSNIRNFPLVSLMDEPVYSVDIQFGEPNESHPAYNSVKFSSDQNSQEIMRQSSEYLLSKGFKEEKVGCPDYPICPKCCASFSGKSSVVEVFVKPETKVDGYSVSGNYSVSVTETFREK